MPNNQGDEEHPGITTITGFEIPPETSAPDRPTKEQVGPHADSDELLRSVWWKLHDMGVPAWISWVIAPLISMVHFTAAKIFTVLIWAVVHIAPTVAEFFIKVVGETRKELSPQIAELAAEILNELTGADFAPEDLPTGTDFKSHVERARAIGARLHDVFREEFAPDGVVGPDQGKDAASRFSGFVVNFGVATAIIGLLGELESIGIIEDFRELGVEVAQNLGLGRLHRLAMRPLINTTIVTPYQWGLNRDYRPTRLKPPELLRAWFRGAINEEQLRTELAEEGYSDERMEQLITDARPMLSTGQVTSAFLRGDIDRDRLAAEFKARGFTDDQIEILIADTQVLLNETEIFRLQRYGVLSQEAAGGLLTQRGWRAENVQLLQQAQGLERVDAIVAETVSAALRDVLDGVMDRSEFTDLLSRLPLVDEERRSLQDLLGIKLLKPRKVITLARMETAFIQGVIDLTEYEEYLGRVGYSDSDRDILVIDLLLRSRKTAEADARKKKRGK